MELGFFIVDVENIFVVVDVENIFVVGGDVETTLKMMLLK